ncbi:MAG TPA: MlaD family protein [Longimicrobiaceae bacterium]|jgi:phospholipid/cholesterol/gamma-HCH transport system substrate-binding protein|nr:MlaD family protein [Longimicrobiaceae bacterium]
MSSANREVQTGLFVIGGVIAVVVALFLLTDPGTLRGRYHVSTRVSTAGGIRKGDPVQLRGVNIGRIRGFTISNNGVVVKLELEKEYGVPRDSKVTLESSGLLGGMTANILPGRSADYLGEGDSIPSVEGAAGAGGLGDIASLTTKADTVLGRTEALLSHQNIDAISGTATQLQSSAVQLQASMVQLRGLATEQRRQLADLTSSLTRSAKGIESAATRPELARAIARTDSITLRVDRAATSLEQTTASLRAMSTSLQTTSTSLNTVVGRIDRGEGTLGKLTQDDALYNNLNAAAVSARALTEDIRANPKRYINVRVF